MQAHTANWTRTSAYKCAGRPLSHAEGFAFAELGIQMLAPGQRRRNQNRSTIGLIQEHRLGRFAHCVRRKNHGACIRTTASAQDELDASKMEFHSKRARPTQMSNKGLLAEKRQRRGDAITSKKAVQTSQLRRNCGFDQNCKVESKLAWIRRRDCSP